MNVKQRTPKSSNFHLVRIVIGSIFLLVATAGAIYPLWWAKRSSSGAERLLKADKSQIRLALKGVSRGHACTAKPGPGILNIPSLGLTAPVEQGLGNTVLDVAIGHDPSTAWPGPLTASLLAAHDVSFFSKLNNLKYGDTVEYSVPCATFVFKVSLEQVTTPGKQIPIPKSGAIVMDTCWPPNALFYTADRYVVTATYANTITRSQGNSPKVAQNANPASLSINIPPGLPFSELELQNNTQPLGLLTYQGSPSESFVQSPEPLQIDGVALEAWFTVLHSLESKNTTWWTAVAPNIPFPNGLTSPSIIQRSPLGVSENVNGSSLVSVTLSGNINGHQVRLLETLHGNKLSITSFEIIN